MGACRQGGGIILLERTKVGTYDVLYLKLQYTRGN